MCQAGTHHGSLDVALAVRNGILHELVVLGHDGRLVNQRRVGRGISRFVLFDAGNIARVGDNDRLVFECLEGALGPVGAVLLGLLLLGLGLSCAHG